MLLAANEISAGHDMISCPLQMDGALGTIGGVIESSACGWRQPFQISEQTWPARFPSRLMSRLCAGGRHIATHEHGEPAEKASDFVRGNRFDRQAQDLAQRFRDSTHRHAFFCNRVTLGTRFGPFYCQPV